MRTILPLHLKYRPKIVADLVGQDNTVKVLTGMFKRQAVPSAILLAGPSGTGKTTTARIIARTVMCKSSKEGVACGTCKSCVAFDAGTHGDYIELNAANERSIDDIRDLIKRSNMMPQVGNMRVIMLDECQQLTSASAQALLKPIEHPPARTLWLLGSMEPNRLLPALVSRCQVLYLNVVPSDVLGTYLYKVAKKEGVVLPKESTALLAELSNGHPRAALQLLDSVIQYTSSLDEGVELGEEMLKEFVLSSSILEDDDKAALKLLVGLVALNLTTTHKAILMAKSHMAVANKLQYLTMFCLHRVLGVDDKSVVWYTHSNKEALSAIERLELDGKSIKSRLVGILSLPTQVKTLIQSVAAPEQVHAICVYEEWLLKTKG